MVEVIAILCVATALLAGAPAGLALARGRSASGFSLWLHGVYSVFLVGVFFLALDYGNGWLIAASGVGVLVAAAIMVGMIWYSGGSVGPSAEEIASAERTSVDTDVRIETGRLKDSVRESITGLGLKVLPDEERGLEDLLAVERKDFNLSAVALAMAREDYPSLKAEKYAAKIDEIAGELDRRLSLRGYNEELLVRGMNRYFFKELGFQAAAGDPRKGGLRNLHLHHVLDTRRGHCLSLSLLYVVLARRVKMPAWGVSVPGHFFVRYQSKKLRRNVETTLGGKEFTDQYYSEKYRPSRESVEKGAYLVNLAGPQIIVEMLNNRAAYYHSRGEDEKALRDLRRATTLGISFAAGHGGLGFVHLRRGEFEEARVESLAAVAIDPDFALGHLSLGEAYLQLGKPREAASHFRRAVDCEPSASQPYTDLGRAFQRMGSFAEARACHLKALKLDPRNASAMNNLGILFHKEDRDDLAEDTFRKALKAAPSFVVARENLARVLLGSGRREEAEREVRRTVRAYLKLIKKHPTNEVYRRSLDAFLAEVGER